jgi:hypothetical protein
LNASKPASNPLPMILCIFFFLLQKCRKKKLRLFFRGSIGGLFNIF